jgi:hypothetical protein
MPVSAVLGSRAFHHIEALFVLFWGLEAKGLAWAANATRLDNFCPEGVQSTSASGEIRCGNGRKSFVFSPRGFCEVGQSRHITCYMKRGTCEVLRVTSVFV